MQRQGAGPAGAGCWGGRGGCGCSRGGVALAQQAPSVHGAHEPASQHAASWGAGVQERGAAAQRGRHLRGRDGWAGGRGGASPGSTALAGPGTWGRSSSGTCWHAQGAGCGPWHWLQWGSGVGWAWLLRRRTWLASTLCCGGRISTWVCPWGVVLCCHPRSWGKGRDGDGRWDGRRDGRRDGGCAAFGKACAGHLAAGTRVGWGE